MMVYLLSRCESMIALGTLSVDADRFDKLVNELVIYHFSILSTDEVLSFTVLHDENERTVLPFVESVCVIVEDVELVVHTGVSLHEELLTVVIQVDLLGALPSDSTPHHLIECPVESWQHDGCIGQSEELSWDKAGCEE